MTTATLCVDGQTVELTEDDHGLVGHIDIDEVRHVVHATITAAGPRAVSPPKWRRP